MAEKLKIISRKGNTYFLGKQKLELGRDKTLTLLKEDKKLSQKIEKEITSAIEK